MAPLTGRHPSFAAIIYALLVLVLGPLSLVRAGHHGHQAHYDLHVRHADTHGHDHLFPERDSLAAAHALVNASLPKIAAANRMKLQQPRFNTRQFPPDGGAAAAARNTTGIPVIGRRGVLTNTTSIGSGAAAGNGTTSRDYIISPALAAAARMVAEATTNTPAASGYTNKAAALKAQYWGQTSPSSGDNANVTGDNASGGETTPIEARAAASSFWMASMIMNGVAPYATASGYKVWRNVKDYGAKGDGKTDDTVAINLAITGGGRCGQACGSSSATPAVIYFPSGTYLISDTLIMYYNTQFLGDVCCPLNCPLPWFSRESVCTSS